MGGTFFFFYLDFSKLELLFAHVLIGHAHNNSEIEFYLKNYINLYAIWYSDNNTLVRKRKLKYVEEIEHGFLSNFTKS